jgi:hypothetical protein
MDERLKFVARFLVGAEMAARCREFEIARNTGHKILERYNETGLEGLTDRSRRLYRHANQLPSQIEAPIARLKQVKPALTALASNGESLPIRSAREFSLSRECNSGIEGRLAQFAVLPILRLTSANTNGGRRVD